MTPDIHQMTRPEIETDRLNLVLPEAIHLPAYVSYCGSARSRYVGGPFDPAKAFEKFCAMAGHWRLRGFGRYVVTLKTSGQPIGHVGALQIDEGELPEMTWTIWDGAFEGGGYAFEAVAGYLTSAPATTGSGRLQIRIDKDNLRSLNLARRIGAKREEDAVAPAWMPEAVSFSVMLRNR